MICFWKHKSLANECFPHRFLPRNQVSSCSHNRFTKTICFFTTQKIALAGLEGFVHFNFQMAKESRESQAVFQKEIFFSVNFFTSLWKMFFSQHCFFLETFSNSKLALKVSYVWENRNSCSKSLEFFCFFLTKTRNHFYFCWHKHDMRILLSKYDSTSLHHFVFLFGSCSKRKLRKLGCFVPLYFEVLISMPLRRNKSLRFFFVFWIYR